MKVYNTQMFKIILALVIFVYPIVSEAVGAPDYLPDGAHPRLYLSSSVMTDLTNLKNMNTTEWQILKNWCDGHIGDNATSGYQGSEWAKYAKTYALCYRMTSTESYANESVIYLEALLDDNVSSNNGIIGDNNGGASSIETDSGYTARIIGVAVPLTRDWLSGSSALTAGIKTRITARMDDWISWYNTSGYMRNDPKDNYYGGYFEMVYTTALSLYGDAGYNQNWLTQSRSMWIDNVLPIINGGQFDPADSMEGWSYYPHHVLSYIKYPVLSEMAQGYTDFNTIGNWHTDIIKSVIHMLRPDRGTMFDDGVWDNTVMSGVSDSTDLINFVATFAPLSTEKKEEARWYVSSLTAVRNATQALEGFLYDRPSETATTPTETSMGWLSYQTKGNVLGRSATWSDMNATWYSVTAWNGDLSEGGRSAGELKIFSRGEYLLPDGTYTSYDGMYSNILSATGSHRYAPFQDWDADNISTTVQSLGGSATAVIVDGLEDVYDTQYYGKTLDQYHRTILYLSPDIFIISDNAQSVAVSTLKRRWYFYSLPSISGVNLRSDKTNADITMWTDGAISTAVGPNTVYPYRSGTYYVDVADSGFTVFQVGVHGFTEDVVAPVSGANTEGVIVNGVVAMFAQKGSGGQIHTATYTINATEHYITDLPINTNVIIKKDGSTIPGSPFNSGQGGVIHFTSTAGNANYSINANGSATCDSSHLNLCTTEPTCTGATGIWCGGVCQASTCTRADVDQSSNINSTDAMLTLRNSLTLDMTSTNWQTSATTGDANCDGSSNSTDAMLILRQSLGLDMSGTGWCVS